MSEATNVTTLLLAIVPLGVAVLGLVVWRSVGRALRPVESMRREAEAITSDHLHRPLRIPAGSDEIPRLAITLNEMLDRIDASPRLQRQFVSDASCQPWAETSSSRKRMEDPVTALLKRSVPRGGRSRTGSGHRPQGRGRHGRDGEP